MFRITSFIFFSFLSFLGWNSTSTTEHHALAAESVEKPENPYVRAWQAEATEKITHLLKQNNIPGAALSFVYKDYSYINTYGVKSVKTKAPIDENSIFRVGSLSKTFAGVLTAKLVKDKKLAWNNHVVDYLPEFQLSDKEQTNRVSIGHILSHTSGLPYHTYTNLVEANIPVHKIIPKLKDVKLIGTEGSIYSYQNAPFSIIGEIHQKATGKSYSYLLENEIFNPIGMEESSTSRQEMLQTGNFALPHRPAKGQYYPTPISNKYYTAVPAGGVNASISDMSQYLKLLLGNYPSLLSSSDLSPIFQARINTPVKRRYFSKWPKVNTAAYGFGWRILDYDHQRVVYHSGYVNNYKGEIALNLDEEIGFCFLMNASGKCAKLTVPIVLDTYAKYKEQIKNWEAENS